MSMVLTDRSSFSPALQQKEEIRRHSTLGTYSLTLFLRDVRQTEPRIVTAENIDAHLECLQFAKAHKVGGSYITRDELMRQLRENLDNTEDRALLDPDVAKRLGLKVK